MADDTLLIDDDDRYSRLRLIAWWDQEKLARAKVLVVGAGALERDLRATGRHRDGVVILPDEEESETLHIEITQLRQVTCQQKETVNPLRPDCAHDPVPAPSAGMVSCVASQTVETGGTVRNRAWQPSTSSMPCAMRRAMSAVAP